MSSQSTTQGIMSRTLPPSHRASLLLLAPTLGFAAFGLGLLALAATTPHSDLPELPLPSRPAALVPAAATPTASVVWAPLFGVPTPEPIVALPEPEPEMPPQEIIEYDAEIYVLRGLVYEENGGWALLETEDGYIIIQRDDILPGGEVVVFIDEEGVEIDVEGDAYFISFDEDMVDADTGLMDFTVRQPVAPRAPSRNDQEEPPARSSTRIPPQINQFGIGSVGR